MPNCIACKSENTEHLEKAPSQELSSWYLCRECGLAYRHPMPDASEYKKYYKKNYRPKDYPTLHDRSVQLHRADRLIPLMRTVGAIPKRMLDYGCANGVLLEECRKGFGCEVVGVELNPLDRQIAAERGITVYPEIEDVQDSWDVVSMVHVLEHLTDPIGFLSYLLDRTDPGGHLVLEIPFYHAASAWARSHMTVWRPEVLGDLVNRSGWHVHSVWRAEDIKIVWLFGRKV